MVLPRILITTSLLCLIHCCLQAQPTRTLTRTGHIDSAEIFKLFYVPVEVPEDITEIQVKEKYSNQGKNVLNLGIYGPEGYELGNTAGFRGWSGGAKNQFFINELSASTGYIPGKISKGTWHILIYASTMIREGMDWELEVTLIKGKHAPAFEMAPAAKEINNRAGWYKGDLHMHTLHSDGKRTQQELLNEAADKRLDFIISTEHNTNSANLQWGKYAKNNTLIINGEEVTTTAYGHWNAIGLKPTTWVEWRYTPQDGVINTYIDQVHHDGGLCIINHPFYTKSLTNGFAFDPQLFDGIEVWNGNWDMLDELAVKWWNDLLRKGMRLIAIGASDTHQSSGSPNNLGTPNTVVYASALSQKGIMTGLKHGKTYITESPNLTIDLHATSKRQVAGIGEQLLITATDKVELKLAMKPVPDAVINLIGSQGIIKSVPANEDNYNWLITLPDTNFIRVEVRGKDKKMLALTNPIWIKNR